MSHNYPIKTIGDLPATRTVTDTVTLTMSDKFQTDAMNILAGQNGAIVVLDPITGAIEAMYSNPSYDPNPLTSLACAPGATTGTGANAKCNETVAGQAFTAENTRDSCGYDPLTSLAYQDIFPPGSTFKIVTTSAAYEHALDLVNTPRPTFSCIPPDTFAGQTTPLCNYGSGTCGGTIAEMFPPSCDTGYAYLGTKIGAASMTADADSFGFNSQPPLAALSLSFNYRLADDDPQPTLTPPVPGTWVRESPRSMVFDATESFAPGVAEKLTVPGGRGGVVGRDGFQLAHDVTLRFTVAPMSTLRVQELLAQRGYLPLSFTSADPSFPAVRLALDQPGSFSWRWSTLPQSVHVSLVRRLNPDGSHYSDPGVPWVSYFNGGDALHGFDRASYGSPQSLGCVEMPPTTRPWSTRTPRSERSSR